MTTSFNPLTAPHDSAFAGPSSSTSTARPSPLPPPRSTAFAPPSSTTASNRRPSIQSPRPLPKPSSLAGSSRPYSPPQHPTKRFPSPPTQPLLPAQANNSNFNTGGRFAASVVSSTTRRPDSNSLAGNSTAPSADELSQFAAVCRLLYYEKDPTAAIKVDSILSKLAAGSRTAYARTMAKVRAEYHLSEEIRRRQEVEKVLEVKPGSEVMKALRISEGGTSAMRSKVARRVRQESLRAFIKSHCVRDMPGTLPFFKSLYAVMYLQSLAAKKGGAGKRRVEWEIDVAVFTEAGAGDWLIDSVTFLKAILGCSETTKEPPPESYFDPTDDEDGAEETISPGTLSPPFITSASATDSSDDEEDREEDDLFEEGGIAGSDLTTASSFSNGGEGRRTVNQQQSIENALSGMSADGKRLPPKVPPHRLSSGNTATTAPISTNGVATARVRTRSTSDPFSDPFEKERRMSVSLADGPLADHSTPSSPPSNPTTPLTASHPGTPTRRRLLSNQNSPPSSLVSASPPRVKSPKILYSPPRPIVKAPLIPPRPKSEEILSPAQQIRIFTLPSYLTDPELRSLCKEFPAFIKLKTKGARFDRSGSVNADDGIKARLGPVVPTDPVVTPRELEEGINFAGMGTKGKLGHGEIRIGASVRDEGFAGSVWERFVGFWSGLFSRS